MKPKRSGLLNPICGKVRVVLRVRSGRGQCPLLHHVDCRGAYADAGGDVLDELHARARLALLYSPILASSVVSAIWHPAHAHSPRAALVASLVHCVAKLSSTSHMPAYPRSWYMNQPSSILWEVLDSFTRLIETDEGVVKGPRAGKGRGSMRAVRSAEDGIVSRRDSSGWYWEAFVGSGGKSLKFGCVRWDAHQRARSEGWSRWRDARHVLLSSFKV